MFGLARVGGYGAEVTLARAMTARMTDTDIDLIDPAEGQRSRWIGGVHYAEGINSAWARAARRHRLLLLVTGPRLPDGPDTGSGPLSGSLDELWAGLVPVTVA